MKSDLRINWIIAIGLTGWLMYLLAPILTPFVAAAHCGPPRCGLR